MKHLTNLEIGNALGVTPQRVSVLKRDGMPTHSIEAAMAWRTNREESRKAHAPVVDAAQLDDGSLAERIRKQNEDVSRARDIWRAAMEQGDPNQAKYHTQFNQATSKLLDLEAEQERRLILSRDYITAKEAAEAMRQLTAEFVNRLDKLALDVAEACNPENPAKAVKALEAWARKTREDLSSDEQG